MVTHEEPYVPECLPLDDPRRRDVPVNVPVYLEPRHFLASVQSFSGGGYEMIVKKVDAQKIAEQRCLAARPKRRRGADDMSDDERRRNVLRARARAKRRVRHTCMEIRADRLLTLTTREASNSAQSMLARWQRWLGLVERAMGRPFHYVAVLEPHPTNPAHLHLHVAVAVFLNVNVLRQCWWQVCGGRGMGNVHVKRLGGAVQERRVGRVASYISKYITKETLVRFNKKSYWASRVSLPEVHRYWLQAGGLIDAIREVVQRFGVRFERAWIAPDQSVFWVAMPAEADYDIPF